MAKMGERSTWEEKEWSKEASGAKGKQVLEKEQVFNLCCLQGQKCAYCGGTWSTQVIFTRGKQLVILEALFQSDRH